MDETQTIDLEHSDVDFPDMHQGLIDQATVAQYFEDLAHAQIYDVLVKGAPQEYAEEGSFDLARGRELFESGGVRGLQVRYRWNGVDWWDTLMRSAQGVRIVRVQHNWDDP